MAKLTFADVEEYFGCAADLGDFEEENGHTWFRVGDTQYVVSKGAIWRYVPECANFECDDDATDWFYDRGLI